MLFLFFLLRLSVSFDHVDWGRSSALLFVEWALFFFSFLHILSRCMAAHRLTVYNLLLFLSSAHLRNMFLFGYYLHMNFQLDENNSSLFKKNFKMLHRTLNTGLSNDKQIFSLFICSFVWHLISNGTKMHLVILTVAQVNQSHTVLWFYSIFKCVRVERKRAKNNRIDASMVMNTVIWSIKMVDCLNFLWFLNQFNLKFIFKLRCIHFIKIHFNPKMIAHIERMKHKIQTNDNVYFMLELCCSFP